MFELEEFLESVLGSQDGGGGVVGLAVSNPGPPRGGGGGRRPQVDEVLTGVLQV